MIRIEKLEVIDTAVNHQHLVGVDGVTPEVDQDLDLQVLTDLVDQQNEGIKLMEMKMIVLSLGKSMRRWRDREKC